jgi:hypothetical protein
MLAANPYLKRALLFAFGLKLFYLLLGNLLPNGWNGFEHIFDVFARNDSGWYHLIAREGYPTGAPTQGQQTPFAFFPLYPAIIALFRQPLLFFSENPDLVYVMASFLAHLFLTCLWVVMLFKWLESTGMESGRIFIYSIFFQVFPYHFFYHMFYGEVLFSSLFMWAMLSVARKKHISLAVSVALLTFCRPTGIVFSAGLGLWIIADNGWFRILKQKENKKQIIALLASPAALCLWMFYLYFHCGDAMVFSNTQMAWGRGYTWPWESLFAGGYRYEAVLSIYVLLLIAASVLLFRNAGIGEKLFVGLNIIFPLLTGTVASYYRYFSVIPQFYVRLFNAIESRWKWVAAACMLLNIVLYYIWVSELHPSPVTWFTY